MLGLKVCTYMYMNVCAGSLHVVQMYTYIVKCVYIIHGHTFT